jgi:hypothetical protein
MNTLTRFVLAAVAAVMIAAGLHAQLPIRETAAPDTFDPQKVLPTLDPATVKDGEIAKYSGPLADCAEVKSFVAGLPASRKTFIQGHCAMMGLPRPWEKDSTFNPVVIVRLCDRDPADKTGENMETTSVDVNGRFVSAVSVYSGTLVALKCDAQQTLNHEINHAVLREYLGAAYQKVPKWFREGLAVHSAGQREERLKVLLSGQLWGAKSVADAATSVEDLCEDNFGPKFTNEDYGHAVLVIEYLLSRNADGVKKLVAALKAGTEFEPALAAAGGLAYADFMAAARAHAKRTLYALEGGTFITAVPLIKKYQDNLKASTDEQKQALRQVAADAKTLRTKSPAPYFAHVLGYLESRSLQAAGDAVNAVAAATPMLAKDGALRDGTLTMLAVKWHAAALRAAGKANDAAEYCQRLLYGYGYSEASAKWARDQLDEMKTEREKAAAAAAGAGK